MTEEHALTNEERAELNRLLLNVHWLAYKKANEKPVEMPLIYGRGNNGKGYVHKVVFNASNIMPKFNENSDNVNRRVRATSDINS